MKDRVNGCLFSRGICERIGNCYLSADLTNQTPDLSISIKGWRRLVNRSVDMAEQYHCPNLAKIKEQAETSIFLRETPSPQQIPVFEHHAENK